MNLDTAIGKHAEWKVKLRSAIMNQETMDAASICRDNCCELGIWLHGEAKTQFSGLESYALCVAKHADFHREAGKIAVLINEKKFAEAEAGLGVGTDYNKASTAVAVAIMRLAKESAI